MSASGGNGNPWHPWFNPCRCSSNYFLMIMFLVHRIRREHMNDLSLYISWLRSLYNIWLSNVDLDSGGNVNDSNDADVHRRRFVLMYTVHCILVVCAVRYWISCDQQWAELFDVMKKLQLLLKNIWTLWTDHLRLSHYAWNIPNTIHNITHNSIVSDMNF